MPTLDSPFQLSPVFKPKIWGRADLRPLFTRPQDSLVSANLHGTSARATETPLIGEVWITDDTSQFKNGPLAGMTLAEASEKYGPALNGRNWKSPRFPILAKYIYTSDWLSVQVHPDDEQARRYDPGSPGKCEMWYIVGAERNGKILLGVKKGVTREELRAAFEKGASRDCLHRLRPKPGEAIYVPAGTVHALGPGLVLFEVEQNSDLTYRLDDFGRPGLDGRPRPLHLDKGLAVAKLAAPAHRDLPRVELREPYGLRRLVLACRHFALEKLTLGRRGVFEGSPQQVEVLSIIGGEGLIETREGWLGFRTGDTWLVPPATGQYRLVPRGQTRLLKFYVPDIEKDFRRPLAKRGVPASHVSKIVFEA
ncbi:MAG: class I mannose-6-phosphate isomerase [Acidobacteriia bacterium]|nr:class I mannose-6-phosphate isomerase [Terriglobia bacterium]